MKSFCRSNWNDWLYVCLCFRVQVRVCMVNFDPRTRCSCGLVSNSSSSSSSNSSYSSILLQQSQTTHTQSKRSETSDWIWYGEKKQERERGELRREWKTNITSTQSVATICSCNGRKKIQFCIEIEIFMNLVKRLSNPRQIKRWSKKMLHEREIVKVVNAVERQTLRQARKSKWTK